MGSGSSLGEAWTALVMASRAVPRLAVGGEVTGAQGLLGVVVGLLHVGQRLGERDRVTLARLARALVRDLRVVSRRRPGVAAEEPVEGLVERRAPGDLLAEDGNGGLVLREGARLRWAWTYIGWT